MEAIAKPKSPLPAQPLAAGSTASPPAPRGVTAYFLTVKSRNQDPSTFQNISSPIRTFISSCSVHPVLRAPPPGSHMAAVPSKDRRSCQMGVRPEATDSLNSRVFSPVPMHPQAALDGRQFCEAVPPTSHMAVSKSGVFSVWGHFFDKPKCPQMSPSQRAKRKPPR